MGDLNRFMKNIKFNRLRRSIRLYGRFTIVSDRIYCINSISEALLLKRHDCIYNVATDALGMVKPFIFTISYSN